MQFFADANATLHVALERNNVEPAAHVPVEPGMNQCTSGATITATEAFAANSVGNSVCELIGLRAGIMLPRFDLPRTRRCTGTVGHSRCSSISQ